MRKTVLGALAVAGLAIVAVYALQRPSEVYAERLAPASLSGPGDQLIAVPGPVGEKGQLLTVIDPKLRAMSVYHIDKTSGTIELRSVRNIHWDLQMTYLNNDGLLPQEIRSGLEQLQPR
jgi:hypothetical protein